MSTRSKKTVVTTTTTKTTTGSSSQENLDSSRTESTGEASSPISSERSSERYRPSSPTMISRIQEKQALASLNDRLAIYIDRARTLELENSALSSQIRTQEETVITEHSRLKTTYEAELSDARKLIDELSRDKARLQIEANKYKAESSEIREKLNRATKDISSLEKRLQAAEGQVNDLTARLSDALSQRKHYESEFTKVTSELVTAQKQLSTAQKQLEDETVMRIDLQNKYQSLKEELAFSRQVHEQEMNETRSRTTIELSRTEGQLQEEYESRLHEALQVMREDNDASIVAAREEVETKFMKNLNDLKNMAAQNDRVVSGQYEELRLTRKRAGDLESQLGKLQAENDSLQNQLTAFENRLALLEAERNSAVEKRDNEIARLRQAIEDQMTEYRDLLDQKISLDLEIANYRKLLEAEETRLNISTSSETTPRRNRGKSSTPKSTGYSLFGGSSRKRKRFAIDAPSYADLSESSSRAGYKSSSQASGDLEISETDSHGAFIKLINNSDKDVNIGGYQLKHTAGDEETVYKFHRSVVAKAKQEITVWNSDSGVTHNPPSDLVMKGQRWFTSGSMSSSLINADGEEVASRSMERCITRSSYYGSGSDSGIEDQKEDRCILM